MMRQSRLQGFTLVELVVIMVLLGTVAAVAAPRFFDLGGFRERGFYDELVAASRYAQKLAVATGCDVRVQISTGGDAYGLYQRVTNCTTGAFTLAVPHPAGDGDFSLPLTELPAGITLSAATFTFDALGRSTGTGPVSVGSLTFTVIGATGYVDTQ